MTNIKAAQWIGLVQDTILKEMRSKTLIFIFIATSLMIFLAHALLKMLMDNNDPASQLIISGANSLSYMFRAINIWSVIIAGIFGISAVRSDFREKIIYQYLTFPISRTQYMFGRIFGAWFLVYGYYLYAYFLSALLFSVATKSVVLQWNHLASMLLMGPYIFLVIFISFLYSLMAGKIGSFLLLFLTVFTISVSSESMRYLETSDYFKNVGLFKSIGLIVYFFFPRINYISEVANAIMFNEEIRLKLGLEAMHLIVTSLFFIFLADRLVRRKNF
ncbi:MAG: ABC transporter permease [Bacteriovorax sp.]|nr:ABC transporter permease [Bacteriovorax sp.]